MTQRDWTYLAVRRQLQGMACDHYEIGLRSTETGKMIPRTWSKEVLLKRETIAWLKGMNLGRMNAAPHDIYIRPQDSQGLILMDDIGIGTIARLKADGLRAAAEIETSPSNYQAWIRISAEPIPQALATHAAKILAALYNADPNSADWRHFGRLAGFTNRKPMYQAEYGKAPYVKAHSCPGGVADSGAAIVQQAHESFIAAEEAQQQRLAAMAEMLNAEPLEGLPEPLRYYQKVMSRMQEQFGADIDYSRLDWMLAKHMAKRGYPPAIIQSTLLQISPNLATRKAGHVEDYVERTVTKAMTDMAVLRAQDARARGRI